MDVEKPIGEKKLNPEDKVSTPKYLRSRRQQMFHFFLLKKKSLNDSQF